MKHSENTPTLSCCFIRHSDIDLYRAITNIESINISSYAFFEWIILINIVDNIICHNEILNYKNISDLKKFYEVNSGMVSIMARETTNAIDEQSFTVKLEYLKRFFTSSLNKKLSISSERASFFKVIKELKEFVISCMHCKHNIENENYFYIMIDDLDVNFDANNINHVKGIAELIRVAKEYNNLLADCFLMNYQIFIILNK